MSDFVYSSSHHPNGSLKSVLGSIYSNDAPECVEYHGQWGSLAVVKNHYYGFEPFEDSNFIIFTTGGPVLNFLHHNYYEEDSNNYKNHAILDKWKYKKNIRWDDDLSGPFAVICINKINNKIELVTDLLLFIPIFHSTLKNSKDKVHIFGTHNDVVAKVSQREKDIDFTSVTDMMLNAAIVSPYTFHKDVFQLNPASIYKFDIHSRNFSSDTYWFPYENYIYKDIDEAAAHLRESLLSSVEKITNGFDEAALFLSGGEDSRVVLASIPKEIKKHAFIFLDSLNREGVIADKAAKCYGAELKIGFRKPTHYLDNMESTSTLLGSQFNFSQLHSYGFHKEFNFKRYDVFLDGLFADTFLKGYTIKNVKKYSLGRHILISRLSSTVNDNNNVESLLKSSSLFNQLYVDEVFCRRKVHLEKLSNYRNNSLYEWIKIWPVSIFEPTNGLQGSFRLFRSFAPFTNSEIVKLSASIPQDWKLNRKIYQKAFKPLLKNSWYIPHSENAHFPYFGPYTNIPLKIIESAKRKLINYKQQNVRQGPWSNWNDVIKTDVMKDKVKMYSLGYPIVKDIFKGEELIELFTKNILDSKQQLTLLQILYKLSTNEKYAVKEIA